MTIKNTLRKYYYNSMKSKNTTLHDLSTDTLYKNFESYFTNKN